MDFHEFSRTDTKLSLLDLNLGASLAAASSFGKAIVFGRDSSVVFASKFVVPSAMAKTEFRLAHIQGQSTPKSLWLWVAIDFQMPRPELLHR